jgi:hypothetical protein
MDKATWRAVGGSGQFFEDTADRQVKSGDIAGRIGSLTTSSDTGLGRPGSSAYRPAGRQP